MDRQLMYLLLQSTLLFTATFALTGRQAHDILSAKIRTLTIEMALLNADTRVLRRQNGILNRRIKKLEDDPIKKKLDGQTWWGDWSSWGGCYNNCALGGRIQSRSRTAVLNPVGKKETETRPCNAVQFAGCIKSYGSNDHFGVSYDFADQMAQATCTAMASGRYVNAVRRECTNFAVDCATVCKKVGRTCFNQLHVYRGVKVLQRGTVHQMGLQIYKYNSCAGNYCGPNFCCCRS